MTIDIEALKAAAEKATPGEWIVYGRDGDYGGGVIVSIEPGPGVAALSAVCSNVVPLETVAWHEDYAPYTKPDDTFSNIVGDSDLGVGVGDDQTALNFAFIAAANPAVVLALIAERAELVAQHDGLVAQVEAVEKVAGRLALMADRLNENGDHAADSLGAAASMIRAALSTIQGATE